VTAYRRPTLQEELREGGRLLEAAGIRGLVDCTLESPPAEVEAALAWAVREAVTNVVRHSRASRCCIDARRVPGAARVEVTDNGRGASEASEGNGLSGLRERLANLGGELRVRSGSEGTVLTVSVPWADRGVSP